MNDWLHDAERLAGVETKPGRAFHGLKRSLVTLGLDVLPREQIAEMTGTTSQTLAAIYRKQTIQGHGDGSAGGGQARTTDDLETERFNRQMTAAFHAQLAH